MARMGKHFEVTLDEKADSFPGIHFERNPDGSTTLTQPKLLHKLFKEYPATDKSYAQNHPYGPTPSSKDFDAKYKVAPATDYRPYFRLLGLLMAAVSFCATKAANPNIIDQQHLLYIVKYLRKTETRGRSHHLCVPRRTTPVPLYRRRFLLATPGFEGPNWIHYRTLQRRYVLQSQCQAAARLHLKHSCRNACYLHACEGSAISVFLSAWIYS